MKKDKSRTMNKKISFVAKLSLTILMFAFLLGMLFIGKTNLKSITGNIYSISELSKSIDTISQGDTINYEINGYNDWEVLYVDKENGTVDVVSKTNTEDVKLESGNDIQSIINKLDETANKYVDDKYAVSARPVNKADLEHLSYDSEFWLNNIEADYILTSKSFWRWHNYDLYAIPFAEIEVGGFSRYSVGDHYETEIDGIKDWIVVSVTEPTYYSYPYICIIPANPIKIEIEDVNTDIEEILNNLYTKINNSLPGCDYLSFTSPDEDIINLYKDFLDSTKDTKMFISGSGNFYINEYRENEITYSDYIYTYSKENGLRRDDYDSTIYYGPATIGFRPVVTLKVDANVDKKDLTDEIKIGDNINYSAKDYNNWKVLSIDKDNNTVDVISGGIVKNITYYGTADYEKIEKSLQSEVDAYKNENAISARVIDNYDIDNLKKIKDKVINQYWTGVKKKILKDDTCEDSHAACKQKSLLAETLSYSGGEIVSYWAPLFSELTVMDSDEYTNSAYYSGILNGDKSYTAGLRPIITLKLDEVKKLDPETKKSIEKETISREKIIVIEQRNKNSNTNTDKKTNSSTKDIETGAISKIEPSTDSSTVTCNCCEQKEKTRPIDYVIITLILLNIGLTALAIITKRKQKKESKTN